MNLNWKDILIISAFLVGAIFITLKITGSSHNTDSIPSETNAQNINTASTEGGPIAANTVNPNVSENASAQPTVTPEGITVAENGRSVESPISKTVNEPVAAPKTESTPAAKVTPAPKVVESAKTTTVKTTPETKVASKSKEDMKPKSAVTPAPNQRTVEPAATPKTIEKPQSSAPYPGGTYYLIAASRVTFEEAQKSFDQYKSLGYNPIMLSPVKSRGINNYRVAIYRNTDKKTVEDYSAQINGKSSGFWIDQR